MTKAPLNCISQREIFRQLITGFLFLFYLGSAICLAQPYVASEGFSRPFLLSSSATVPGFAVATATGEDGTVRPYAYWSDREGLYRRALELSAVTETLLEARGIRAVHAASLENEIALAWVIQDLRTGATKHRVSWRGEEQTLLETLAPFPLALATTTEGPAVLYSRTVDRVERLYLWRWGGALTEIYSSELSLEKIALIFDDMGGAHAAWLEGFNDRQAVGVAASKWQLKYLKLSPEDDAQDVKTLGQASNLGIQSRVALTLVGMTPWFMWPGEEGRLQVAALGQEPRGLEPGYPMGVFGSYAYWTRKDSLKRLDLNHPLAETENLVWSPNAPEVAHLATSPELHIAWYGASEGGAYALYAATTETPAEFSWRDHVAARLGWNPHSFWQAALGQTAVSLLVALLISSVLIILFWPLSIWLKHIGFNATFLGVALGLLTLSLGLGLAAWRMAAAGLSPLIQHALLGTWAQRLICFISAAALTFALRHHRDNEQQMATLLSASLSSFLALSLLVFLTFQSWLELWNGTL